MKRLSLKQKLTLWITTLMLFLVGGVLIFMVGVSSYVVRNNAQNQLSQVIRSNLTAITKEDGKLVFGDIFSFQQNGVSTLVYNQDGALLAGQPPLSFTDTVPFSNGLTRPVQMQQGEIYFVLDFWLPFDWNSGVWVRGIMQTPEISGFMSQMLLVAVFVFPLLILVSAIGAYRLVYSAIRPVNQILQAVGAINEGKDLSKRIGLPPGKDEISQLAAAFDQMFARLETSFEAESQFTSDASHELRTPTAVILAQCDYAEKNAKTVAQYQQAIEVIHRQTEKMSTLIAQLLHMTRLEQGTVHICLEEADFSALVQVICEEQVLLKTSQTIHTDIESDLIAQFDVTLMTRLLQNLISNASKYGKEGGNIWVTAKKMKNQIVLSVRDDGIGIAQENLEKIWLRFYQVSTSRGHGVGLGLPMVQQIVQLHHGTIVVESKLGQGSIFTVTFPTHMSVIEK